MQCHDPFWWRMDFILYLLSPVRLFVAVHGLALASACHLTVSSYDNVFPFLRVIV